MALSANLNKQSQLTRPGAKGRGDSADQSWLNRFWLLLALTALLSLVAIFFYVQEQDEIEEEVYVSVSVRTSVGLDQQQVICKLSLLIDPEQEKGIQKRQKMLEAVVGGALAEAYQGDKYPQMAAVRQSLYLAINQKLPRKLQVQDVLIQQLLVGMG